MLSLPNLAHFNRLSPIWAVGVRSGPFLPQVFESGGLMQSVFLRENIQKGFYIAAFFGAL